MLTLQAVAEVAGNSGAMTWPVAAMEPYSWLVLDGGCTDEQVGLFVSLLGGELAAGASIDELLEALLAEEGLILAGGLRIGDTATGVEVSPGCCAGLEDWRDWVELFDGGSPWLGHDPGPQVENLGHRLRVWQDGGPGRRQGRWADVYVELPTSALSGLLLDVRRDLIGFLGALRAWTVRMALGDRGVALVEAVDANFAISAPLVLPGDG
ncbi:hypothetical protein GCM10027290_05190 [Micromonospora sonneratiae]|uniref:Uncharacterized protein n=1 Tax=Micromonospora sonneratiae TaxID=1184706 RepID=A0ABW3YQE9_9ACTN